MPEGIALQEEANLVRRLPTVHSVRVSALVSDEPQDAEHLEDAGWYTSYHVTDETRRAGQLLAERYPDYPGTFRQLLADHFPTGSVPD